MPIIKNKLKNTAQKQNQSFKNNQTKAKRLKRKNGNNALFFVPALVILMAAIFFGSLGNSHKTQANAYEIGGVLSNERASSNGLVLDLNFDKTGGSYNENEPQKILNLVNKQTTGLLGETEDFDDSDPVYDQNGFFAFNGEKQIIKLDGNFAPKADFTYEVWLRADSSGKPEYALVSDANQDEKSTAGIKIKDKYWWFMGFNDGNKVYIPYPDKNIDDDWHHVAVTRKDETLTIYVDGQPAEVTRGVNKFSLSNDYLTIGASRKGGKYDEFFKGDISQVRIYARSLSDEEIITNIKNTKPSFIKSSTIDDNN